MKDATRLRRVYLFFVGRPYECGAPTKRGGASTTRAGRAPVNRAAPSSREAAVPPIPAHIVQHRVGRSLLVLHEGALYQLSSSAETRAIAKRGGYVEVTNLSEGEIQITVDDKPLPFAFHSYVRECDRTYINSFCPEARRGPERVKKPVEQFIRSGARNNP